MTRRPPDPFGNARGVRLQPYAVLLALLFGGGAIHAQTASPQSEQFQARINEIARELKNTPRLKKLSQEQADNLVEFVAGNMLFVLLHELAHAVMSDFDLPVLGRDEDAADDFAVLRGLNVGSAFSHRMLSEAAKGWFLSDKRDRKDGEPLAYYDEHGLDKQRAFNIVCVMFGSDPSLFKDLAKEAKLPEDRQATCPRDYERVSKSWPKVLKPVLRAADQPKIQVEVVYGDGKGKFDAYARGFRSLRLLETVAENASNLLAWEKPFKLEMKTCGFINAAWFADTRELILCYELAADFADLYQEFNPARPAKQPPAKQKRKSK